ncbi:MAG: hypothetical protein QM723_39315 [Myxococcaceae bacterium]
MADSKSRADLSAKRAGDGYDVGVHAQDELGTFDLGICVDGAPGAGESLGLFVNAPRIGKMKLAFAVDADGKTRLAALERRNDAGKSMPVAAVLAIDETRLLKTQAELARAKDELEQKQSSLEEARDRAAALKEDLGAALEKVEAQKALLEEHTRTSGLATSELEARLALERNEKLEALSDREKLKSELKVQEDRASQLEADATQATARGSELDADLAEAKAKLSRLEADAEESKARVGLLETELSEAKARVTELETAHEEARSSADAHAQGSEAVKQELQAARDDLTQAKLDLEAAQREREEARRERDEARTEREEARRERDEAKEAKAKHEGEVADETGRVSAELTAARAELDLKNAELELLRTEKTGLEGDLATARSTVDATEALMQTQSSELEAARAQLSQADGQLNSAKSSAQESLAKAIAERDEARNVARTLQVTVSKLQAERDEARNVARSLHQRTNTGEVEALKADAGDARATLDAERKIASQLVTEKQRLQLQIDSLSRQLDNERTARAKLATERDDWREKALGPTAKRDFSREETKPYELSGMTQTQPAIPIVREGIDPKTDPIAPIPGKKKP